jgi:hypothetical protein
MAQPKLEFPNGKRFAFTVIDDTDDGTLENLKPIYDLLASLGMRTTKTVWPLRHDGPSHFFACQTLEDPDYRSWVLDLQSQGFEITWHCVSFESSTRERTLDGLRRFEELFKCRPRVHANHAHNRENLYWGNLRVDIPLLGWLFRRAAGVPRDHFLGHVEGSPYWWGDVSRDHVKFGRNLTFNRLNLATVNPSMPYQDPRRPLVPLWFSASDAESVKEFNRLTAPENQDRLEHEGGFSIVATHFGKGFVRDGEVNPVTRRNLEALAQREGWFPTTGELLDWLSEQRDPTPLPAFEWTFMQLAWALDLLKRKFVRKFGS